MLKKLRHFKKHLTPQQYRTIKGQILSRDFEGAEKGIHKLSNRSISTTLENKEVNNNVKTNGNTVGTARD